MKEFIEIPFGAKDSELGGWEYNIPEGYIASIENGKIVVKKEESGDEKIRKWIINEIKIKHHNLDEANVDFVDKAIAWLENKGEKIKLIENFDTEFEKQVSYLIASATNREYEYTEDFIKWAANGLLEYAKHEVEKQGEHNPYSGVSFKYNGHTWGMCARDNGVDILLDKQLFKHLEKQDEQKPTDEEMKILLQTEYEKGKADAIEAAMKAVTKDKESAIKFLKSAGIINANGKLAEEYVVNNVEQKAAWSEDDIRAIDRACVALRAYSNGELPNFLPSELLGYADKLQSLIPQNRWKPSDEQIQALEFIVHFQTFATKDTKEEMEALLNDIKKLREE